MILLAHFINYMGKKIREHYKDNQYKVNSNRDKIKMMKSCSNLMNYALMINKL